MAIQKVQFFKDLPGWLRLGIIFPLCCLNGWLFLFLFEQLQPLSSLLIAAIILSFLLNLPIQFLQKQGFPRAGAISLIFILTLLLLAVMSIILLPLIVDELSELVINMPGLIDSGTQQLQALQQWAISQQFSGYFTHLSEQAITQLSRLLQATSNQLLSIILRTINRAINIIFLLVLTFFMVLKGDAAWQGIFSWLSPDWSLLLQSSIQKTFKGYFASQALISTILTIALTIVFILLGTPYAVLYGVSIGLASLIPYASTIMVTLVSILVALDNFPMGLKVLGTAITVGLINDNLIAPRIMSHTIGLNPIWLVISLVLGVKLAGFLGLVIAVPIASVVKQVTDMLRLPAEQRQSPV